MCATYVCDRIHILMNTVESKLGIREEIEELENLLEDEELDILKILKTLQEMKEYIKSKDKNILAFYFHNISCI